VGSTSHLQNHYIANDSCTCEYNKFVHQDPLEACLDQFGEDLDLDKLMEQADTLLETAPLVSEEKEVVPDSPKKELKPLPDSLKYKFLGPAESLPVIIASDLKDAQVEELLEVLREH
jgi:hypothetical protein